LMSQATGVKGQKLPPMLDTGSTDPSAFDVQAIKLIMDEYKNNVTGTTDANRATAKLARNRLIAICREQTDAMFNGYLKNDRKKRAIIQFVLDFLEIGAATAIGITNGERAKSVISEGLGALQASRTSLNKNFQLLERQILINKMAADRATILTSIYAKRDLEASQYPWEDARADLRTYRDAGTIDGALINLSSDVGKQKEDAEDGLRKVQDKPITGAASPADETSARTALQARNELRSQLANAATQAETLTKLQTIVTRLEAADKQIADLLAASFRTKQVTAATANGTQILDVLREVREQLTILNRRDLVRKVNDITVEVATQ
jgi:hypothetical protein